jgi:hypothetical protein
MIARPSSVQPRRRSIAHRRATNARRLAAWWLDGTIALGLYVVLWSLGWRPGLGVDAIEGVGSWLDRLAMEIATDPWVTWRAWIAAWLPWVVWTTAQCVVLGRTLGWKAFGLRVVDREGMEASPIRLCVLGVGYVAWPASLGLLMPAAWVSRSQRGIAERVAGVWVVREGRGAARHGSNNRAKQQ